MIVSLIAVLAILVAGLLLLARHDAAAGISAMKRVQAALNLPALRRDPQAALAQGVGDVRAARSDFRAAAARLRLVAPVLPLLGWIPHYGPEAAASPTAVRLADQTAMGTLYMLRGLQPVVAGWGGARRPTLAVLLGRVAGQRSRFAAGCSSLREAATSRQQLGPGAGAALGSSLMTFDRQFHRLQILCRGLVLLPRLAGYGHPSRYLLAYQNPAELRATGGYIGSFGLVTMRDGRMSERFAGTEAAVTNLSVPPPQPMEDYNQETGWLFMDSNWSPDFPTSAALERFFLRLNLGEAPPGVINVTPQAAADVLAATGPLYIPAYQRWVNAHNIAQLSDYYAHFAPAAVQPGAAPLTPGAADTHRKEFIGIVAKAVLARLDTLSADRLVRMADELRMAIQRRDLLVNFADPREQALVRALGADGALKRVAGDYLYVVDTNLSYNKINPWVTTAVQYHVQIEPNRWVRASLAIRLSNFAPTQLVRDSLGPGYGQLGGPLDYADYVRVYVPEGAQLTSDSGWTQSWTPGPAYDKMMFSGYVIVRHNTTRTIYLHYLMPPNVLAWSRGARYRVLIQHQPGSYPRQVTVLVTHDGQTDAWTVPHPVTDITRAVRIHPMPLQVIPLPSQPWPVVSPNHWIEPHAFLAKPYFHP